MDTPQTSGRSTNAFRCLTAIALLAVAAFALLSLLLGAPWLETRLPHDLPLGNALAALGLCAMAGASVALSARNTALRSAALATLAAAALWLPVSVMLAGNVELNFDNDRGAIWLACSAVVGTVVLCTLSWALIAAGLSRIRRSRAQHREH